MYNITNVSFNKFSKNIRTQLFASNFELKIALTVLQLSTNTTSIVCVIDVIAIIAIIDRITTKDFSL